METVSELNTIKWLLVAILIAMAIIAVAAIVIATIFWFGYRVVQDQGQSKAFKYLADEYLNKDQIDDLVSYVEDRLKSHPKDVWAHWYMGQAKYRKGAYPEAKRSFEKVLELEPSWDELTESWFEKINKEIKKGPKLVD